MPRGMYRSRTLRRVKVRTPGGKVNLHYEQRKPSKAVCTSCQKVLTGVARELPHKLAKLPKTKRRPERPFGGVLCSRCTRRLFQTKARLER
jgi:large subunit ribosomal protein L34e